MLHFFYNASSLTFAVQQLGWKEWIRMNLSSKNVPDATAYFAETTSAHTQLPS